MNKLDRAKTMGGQPDRTDRQADRMIYVGNRKDF
jgi:hypothetical protein